MTAVLDFLSRTRGVNRLATADTVTYLYLTLGTIVMFGPVLWLVLSSFKDSAELVRFPPRLLPYSQQMVTVEGYDDPLPLFTVTLEDGTERQLAQVRRVGIEAQMIDPADPDEIIGVNIDDRQPVEQVTFALDNYVEGIDRFNFWRYFTNSVIVTVAATILTLLINSMAAFALSKYRFRGRDVIFVVTIATLMVPLSVVLVPVFLVITEIGWNNNLLGVIVPGAATPTGVFLLRQYMLTIPDELIESARIDGASEWRIYLQIMLPLARPALAVLAIFSVMWRWNDFLWPLIVLSRNELFTLQVGLNSFQGELQVQWDLILAMTVLTLLPITIVFAFLQRFITSGIATTGMK
jgi:alpha-1,4-digalacturonate transport system permease protein